MIEKGKKVFTYILNEKSNRYDIEEYVVTDMTFFKDSDTIYLEVKKLYTQGEIK